MFDDLWRLFDVTTAKRLVKIECLLIWLSHQIDQWSMIISSTIEQTKIILFHITQIAEVPFSGNKWSIVQLSKKKTKKFVCVWISRLRQQPSWEDQWTSLRVENNQERLEKIPPMYLQNYFKQITRTIIVHRSEDVIYLYIIYLV